MSGFSESLAQTVSIVPTLGASGGGAAIGNGTLTGTVTRLGANAYLVSIDFAVGSTTNLGSGYFYFALPAPYNGIPLRAATAAALFQDAGVNYIGSLVMLSGVAQLIPFYGNATVSPTVPFTWAAGDVIKASIIIFL